MKHLQPISEKFNDNGFPLKSFYRVDGKLYAISMQSGGSGRPHDPYMRHPLVQGCAEGTNPVEAVELKKGDAIRIHYRSIEGQHCRMDKEV